MNLTLCDWSVAIAAHAYETGCRPTMTDATYDRVSLFRQAQGTELPGFGAETGQWVHNMDRELLERLYRYALSLNDGKDDLHQPAIKAALDHYKVAYGCCLSSREGHTCHD